MQEPAIHRGTDEHPGNGFGCGARIAQRFGAQRVEVLLVKHAIATRDDHTSDLLIGPGAHRGGDVIQGGTGRAHELSATAEPCTDTGEQQPSGRRVSHGEPHSKRSTSAEACIGETRSRRYAAGVVPYTARNARVIWL